ncbi:MAG: low specificity L-threonine aldolase [Proteobacteria bacterium]|nr:low specificity L-threonine aldolase [Pseudomonadota bacterium]
MNFCSDNVTGAAPEIMEALNAANEGSAMPYGDDELTRRAVQKIAEVFETEVEVFFVPTGTAANALALSVMAPGQGGIFCHQGSHVHNHEAGAPEFYTGGAKLYPLGGDGKFSTDILSDALDHAPADVHHVRPAAVTLSQTTERGTLYTIDEITALADVAHNKGLTIHMDGSRLANALAAQNAAPADMTWRAGIDILSLGASKNGALAAEAVVIFNRDLAKEFGYRRKRGGHLFSKMRFLAAQFDAYLEDGRWLRWAGHANQMAKRLGAGLAAIPSISLGGEVESNMLFPALPVTVADALNDAGFLFYRMSEGETINIRLVTAFNTKADDVDRFIEIAAD